MDSPMGARLGNSDDTNSFREISSGLDHNASSPVTPKSDKIPVAFNFDNGSSNHDSESSYSELDSEAEAFYSSLNYHLVSPGTMDTETEKQMSYGELMKRFVQCEEELKTTSLKLQESEQEIEKLKGETEKKDSSVLLADNLCAELETARREIETRDLDIETGKRRVLELQMHVVDIETKLSDSSFKFESLVNELEVSRECLLVSDAENSKLKEMLCDCKQSFSTEKTKLQTDIAGLLEKQALLEAQVKEIESSGEVSEDQIKHSDEERLELQTEINSLKTDLASQDELTEALNKDFDKHKLRYDMLIAEKDGVCAELNNLKAEMRSRNIQIEQMEEQLNHLSHKNTELVSESRKAKNAVEELRAMVKELEKQVELQRHAIAEGEEEKREAIRQLCFSLDHYKSGYKQLLKFLSGNNKQQQAVMD